MGKLRRDQGTGGIYQRKSDGRWLGSIEAGYTAKGTRRRITVSATTQAEVKRKLRDKRLQLDREGLPSVAGRVTVKRWSDTWLENTRTQLRPKPWATDRSAVRRWIVPTIGHRKLEDLTPQDVRAVSKAIRDAGRSTSTARRCQNTLERMLKAAMIDGHQIPARVLLVDAPGVAVSDRDDMPVTHALAVLNVAHEHLPHWSRWLVQILYGMRPAEVLGTTWDAIDLQAGTLTVEWQLQPLPYLDPKNKAAGFRVPDGYEIRHITGAHHLTRPKTKKGHRVIPLVPVVHAALEQWQLVAPVNPWGLVWPRADGGPASDKHDGAEWYALQDTAAVGHPAGRHWYIYEARHGFATRLMEEGVDENVITALMGHSSILTSRGYQHSNQGHALDALTRTTAHYQLPAAD